MTVGSFEPVSLVSSAYAELRPQEGLTVSEIDPVILVRSVSGGWIRCQSTDAQKAKLVEIYSKIRNVAAEKCSIEDISQVSFNIEKVYAEIKGEKNYHFFTDSSLIKDLRKVVSEILNNKNRHWEEYLSGFRSSLGVSVAMSSPSFDPPSLEEAQEKFKGENNVELAVSLFKESKQILDDLKSKLPADLREADKEARSLAIDAAINTWNRLRKEAVLFAVSRDENASIENLWTQAKELLQQDQDKDRMYLEDAVRLVCKDRESYLKFGQQIDEKYPHKAIAEERELSWKEAPWEKLKSKILPPKKEVVYHPVVTRRDGAEALFTQLTLAIAQENSKEVEFLLDSALFHEVFKDLHKEEKNALKNGLCSFALSPLR